MIIGLLAPIVIAVIVITASRRSGREGINSAQVRRFFQYLLLFALVVITAVGLSGLLSQALGTEVPIGSTALARNTSFVVVGAPLLFLMYRWTRRTIDEDREYTLWMMYIAAASLVSLLVIMTAVSGVISAALRFQNLDGGAFADLLVWSIVWLIHWRLDQRSPHRELHHLLGSLASLVVLLIGTSNLMGGLFEKLTYANGAFNVNGTSDIYTGISLVVAAVPIWVWYWFRHAYYEERDELWTAYVLIPGVAVGVNMAIASISTALYRTLVWFFGDPLVSTAQQHFSTTPMRLAVALTGVATWMYHSRVVKQVGMERTEARRIYEYLMSGIAIVASAIALATLTSSLIEYITRETLSYRQPATNTFLAGITLLAVSIPIWFVYWSRITAASAWESERHSPTRRIYLFLLFGVGGIVAVGALIAGVYTLFQSIFSSSVSSITLREIRIPLGVLASTALLAGYHWSVFHKERSEVIRPNLKYVLLVGPSDAELDREISRLGVRVEHRATLNGAAWNREVVLAQVTSSTAQGLLLTADRSEGVALAP